MQYYTKQQMQGAQRYTGLVRIGNWNEDIEMNEVVLKDYLAKRDRGELKLDRFQRRMQIALAPVELTTLQDDGMVHFGDVVHLRNLGTGALLACDVEDRNSCPGEIACAMTATTLPDSSQPCARNTFILTKYTIPPQRTKFERVYPGNELHLGQKFRLIANPMVTGRHLTDLEDPLYVRSLPMSTHHFSKKSRRQEVMLSPVCNYSCVWVALCMDPIQRIETEGQPVKAGACIVIQHASTGQNLSCPGVQYPNDFGRELEVCAHTAAVYNATGNLEHTMHKGLPESVLAKREQESNFWAIEVGETVKEVKFQAPGETTVEGLLQSIRRGKEAEGKDKWQQLLASLDRTDAQHTGWVKSVEFVRLLKLWLGVEVIEEQLEGLNRYFDWDTSASIRYNQVLRPLIDTIT